MVSSPVTRPVVADEAVRALAVEDRDALGLGLGDLLGIGRDLLGRLERDDGHVEHAGAHGGAGDVEGRDHAAAGVVLACRRPGRRSSASASDRTPGRGPQRGAGGIEGDVAAADDHDPLAEVGAEALVDVEEELDRAQHAVELVAGEVEVAAPTGAHRQEERLVPAEQLVDRARRGRPGTTARTSMPSSRIASISRAMSSRARRYSGMPSTIIPPSRSAAS